MKVLFILLALSFIASAYADENLTDPSNSQCNSSRKVASDKSGSDQGGVNPDGSKKN